MPSATSIATKKKGSADKPVHAHLRRSSHGPTYPYRYRYIGLWCQHNSNYFLLTQVSRWKQRKKHAITIMCTSLLIVLRSLLISLFKQVHR